VPKEEKEINDFIMKQFHEQLTMLKEIFCKAEFILASDKRHISICMHMQVKILVNSFLFSSMISKYSLERSIKSIYA